MAGISSQVLIIIFLTGILPTLLWLFFWLREDRFQPEPIGLLILTFIAGGLSVFLIMPLKTTIESLMLIGTEKILTFAAIEEIVKLVVVMIIDFNSSYLDEPIDYAVYLITGALGFATVENVFFLLNHGVEPELSFIVETGTLRFLGATILHSILAATIGLIIGFVFYKKKITRFIFMIIGLGIVIILHTIFNYFIIKYIELNGFLTLAILWVITLFIISMFEKVRNIKH